MNDSQKSAIHGFCGKERRSIEESRLVEVMQAMQQLSRLRTAATNSSVYARQKRREAAIKREEVWLSDGRLMGEIQRLAARGEFDAFADLQRLAESCQFARDILGPIEQEVIETEQEWEGHTWILRRAEEDFQSDFQSEFEIANSYPASPSSIGSSQSAFSHDDFALKNSKIGPEAEHPISSNRLPARFVEPSSPIGLHSGNNQVNDRYDLLKSAIDIADQSVSLVGSLISESDSGLGDIDEKLASIKFGDIIQIPPEILRTHPNTNDYYAHLLTDFDSRRERINKWLESTVLLSHFEGTTVFNILKQKLDLEHRSMPSNWAQLVMAFWEFDEAAVARSHKQRVLTQESVE